MGKSKDSGQKVIPTPPVSAIECLEREVTNKGPLRNRSCTDVICLLLFLVFLSINISIAVWAYFVGDPRRLIYPTDSYGHICGVSLPTQNKPYLFYFDMMQCAKVSLRALSSMSCPTPSVCVEECPTRNWVFVENLASAESSQDLICKYNADLSKPLYELIFNEECAAYYLSSKPVAGRCFPHIFQSSGGEQSDDVTTFINGTELVDRNNNTINITVLAQNEPKLLSFVFMEEEVIKIVNDFAHSWWVILCFLGLAMILCLVLIVLMRWICGIVIWSLVLLFVGFFAFAIYYCFDKYADLKENPKYAGGFEFTFNPEYYIHIHQTWLVLGIITSVILLIILLLLLFLRKRLQIAIALIKEASKALSHMLSTLLWPLIPFLLQLIAFGFWAGSTLCLATTGQPQYVVASNASYSDKYFNDVDDFLTSNLDQLPCDPNNTTVNDICNFVKYGNPEYTIILQVYQLFVWFWMLNFIIGLSHVTLAGSYASYYWAWNKPKNIPSLPLLSSLARCLRYHIGSIAFGSLLVAIVQIIRVFLEFLDRRLRAANNIIAKFIIKCLKCCFWCLEKFIKFINRNAYILVAVYGNNFCTSAKEALSLLVRNVVRALVLDGVTDFLIFVSKLFVVAGIGVLSFFFFSGELAKALPSSNFSQNLLKFTQQLNYYPVPVVVIILMTYIISTIFFNVYSMAVDTMFLCFLEDLEKNDGSAERPYYMSKDLMRILGKKNKTEKQKKKLQKVDKPKKQNSAV